MKQQVRLLASAIISVVLAVICLAASIFAWLVSNQVTDINNFNVQVDVNNLDASYVIYKYDDVDIIQTQDFSLSEYDSVITSRNTYTPIILELTISGDCLKTNNTLNLDIFCTDTALNTMSLSNVLCFKGSFLNITSQDTTEIYNQALTQLNSATEHKFINNNIKTQTISVSLANYQTYKINENTLKYYIKIDYKPELIENLVEFDFSSVSNTNLITFNADITKIEIYEVGS